MLKFVTQNLYFFLIKKKVYYSFKFEEKKY